MVVVQTRKQQKVSKTVKRSLKPGSPAMRLVRRVQEADRRAAKKRAEAAAAQAAEEQADVESDDEVEEEDEEAALDRQIEEQRRLNRIAEKKALLEELMQPTKTKTKKSFTLKKSKLKDFQKEKRGAALTKTQREAYGIASDESSDEDDDGQENKSEKSGGSASSTPIHVAKTLAYWASWTENAGVLSAAGREEMKRHLETLRVALLITNVEARQQVARGALQHIIHVKLQHTCKPGVAELYKQSVAVTEDDEIGREDYSMVQKCIRMQAHASPEAGNGRRNQQQTQRRPGRGSPNLQWVNPAMSPPGDKRKCFKCGLTGHTVATCMNKPRPRVPPPPTPHEGVAAAGAV